VAAGQVPAHGACAGPTDTGVASIRTNPDTPLPPCQVVLASQRLLIVNATDAFGQHGCVVTVRFAGYGARRLDVGERTTYRHTMGSLLEPGVHLVRMSWTGHSYRAELVLCREDPAGSARPRTSWPASEPCHGMPEARESRGGRRTA